MNRNLKEIFSIGIMALTAATTAGTIRYMLDNRSQTLAIPDIMSWRTEQLACLEDPEKSKAWREWCAYLDDIKSLSPLLSSSLVNMKVNEMITYTHDIDQYGALDKFSAPVTALVNKKGDCDDYAILKYESLRHMGFKDSDLYLGIMTSTTTTYAGQPAGHLICVVSDDKGGFLVLDNDSVSIV
jgi:predicted transglutaminase-like cysteine proteinase